MRMSRRRPVRAAWTVAALAALALTPSLTSAPAASAHPTTAVAVPRAVDGAPLDDDELSVHDVRTSGYEVHQVQGSGALGAMTERSRFPGRWDQVLPADLDGDGQDEIVVHSTSSRAYRFYDVRADGSLGRVLRSGTFADAWTHLAAMDIRGDGRDELLLYSGATGAGRYLSVTAQYTLPTFGTRTHTRGWDQIVGIDLDGDDRDEVVFYDRGVRWSAFDVSSEAGLRTLGSTTIPRSWSAVAALDFDRDGADELVLYDAATGAFRMHQASSQGLPTTLSRSGTWNAGYTSVTGVQVDPGPQLAQVARQILDRVNAERRTAGLAPLTLRNAMLTEAHRWSQVMADEGRMRHRDDLTAGMPGGWRSIGENVAYGYRDAAAVMSGWMGSSGHRENILGAGFTHIGIGVARAPDGSLYYTQIFARY